MEEILDLNQDLQPTFRRRKLLPLWIKIFIWIFMVLGVLTPISFIFSLLGNGIYQSSIYGIYIFEPLSIIGLGMISIFLLKGIAAFGLWTEKDWAIILGILDAIIGITICTFVMLVYPFFFQGQGFKINLRIELLFLIPFLIKLINIKPAWQNKSLRMNEMKKSKMWF